MVALFVGKFQAIKRPGDLLQAMVKLRTSAGEAGNGARLWSQTQPQQGGTGEGSAAGASHTAALQCAVPNVLAVFVGSGELEKELRDLATREKLRVHFTGFKNQSELPAIYAAADALVLPSESETWGLAVNEGMACGLPAIVSDAVGCAPDLIEEGVTGFTYPVGDTEQLAARLQALGEMKSRRHDFGPALAGKLLGYCVEAAVLGTMKAVGKLTERNAEMLPGDVTNSRLHGPRKS
ncbi:MAG: glycosyltransferase family 4 protein [Verrucomicrobia bacterium]|nr:glycosyltransferase family 4 protein [Verrucomicrobiota bacterium]